MFQLKSKWLALAAGALLAAGSALAQDSGPLIDLLIKKGLINDQEGEELRADLAREASAAVTSTISGGKSTASLSIAGRIQVQYAGLATDIDGTAADPALSLIAFLAIEGLKTLDLFEVDLLTDSEREIVLNGLLARLSAPEAR